MTHQGTLLSWSWRFLIYYIYRYTDYKIIGFKHKELDYYHSGYHSIHKVLNIYIFFYNFYLQRPPCLDFEAPAKILSVSVSANAAKARLYMYEMIQSLVPQSSTV